MRFEAYLTEGKPEYEKTTRTVTIDEAEAVKLIRQNCMKAWTLFTKHRIGMWRGNVGTSNDYATVDPSKFTRASQNTKNYYTWWMDGSKDWSKYPKRSQSVVGSSNIDGAYGGSQYLMLPYDGSNMAICPRTDLWNSFTNTNPFYDLSNLNDAIQELFQYYDMGDKLFSVTNSQGFYALVKEFDKKWSNLDHDEEYDKMYKDGSTQWEYGLKLVLDMKESGAGLAQTLGAILDPEANDFQLLKPGEKFPVIVQKEIWTDGKCVMINTSMLETRDRKRLADLVAGAA